MKQRLLLKEEFNQHCNMKTFRSTLSLAVFSLLLTLFSCKKNNNDFGVAETFNLDTIYINPSTDIAKDFEISWAVTTTGYPAFFLKLYLSNDNQLDTLNDIKITETGSVDDNPTLDSAEETQFYMLESVTGNNNESVILHNKKTDNPNDSGWETSKPFPNPSGTTKYIIGYFYNAPGLQIKYGRYILAVPVSFK